MHSDGNSKPVEEVSQRIYNLQLAHRQESGGAEHHAENRVDDERADAHKELRREVIGVLVDYLSGRVSESQEAHVEHFQLKQLAEKEMSSLVHDVYSAPRDVVVRIKPAIFSDSSSGLKSARLPRITMVKPSLVNR